ncbi:hypothetical protein [Archaeoglobus sp.]
MSRYIGFGAFTTGFVSDIFIATVDPVNVLSNAMIYVLSEILRVFTQLYPEMHNHMGPIFWLVILLMLILPFLSFLSDFINVLSYGFLNLMTFGFGMIAGLLISDQSNVIIPFYNYWDTISNFRRDCKELTYKL